MDNKIDISWKHAIRPTKNFIERTIEYANANDIVVILSDTRGVEFANGLISNGYFTEKTDSRPGVLAVACGQPQDNWFPILVHESSHMDQFIEDSPHWINNRIGQWEMWDIVELWLDHNIELNEDQLNNYIGAVRDLELDCEKRAAEKIEKYRLPIDAFKYIKSANAYVMFYNVMARSRKWYTIGKEPYNIKAILDIMPYTFSLDYNNPSEHMMDLIFREVSRN